MFKLIQKLASQAVSPEPLSATSIRCSQAIIQYIEANKGYVILGNSAVADKEGIYLSANLGAGAALDSIWLQANGVGNNMDLSHLYILAGTGDGVNVYYEEY